MDSPLRIIQVINVRWFNATAWYALFLARLLQEAGHKVLVLTLPGTDVFRVATEWGLAPVALPLNVSHPLGLVGLFRSLSRIVHTFQPHVVNCHRGENFILWGMLRASGLKFALVRTRGDQRPPRANAINCYLHNRTADALIATNSATAFEFTHNLHSPEHHVHTILGGVDTAKFRFDPEGRSRVRHEFGLTDSCFVLGLLGRLDTVKGIQELIEATGALLRREAGRAEPSAVRNLRLLLVGFPATLTVDHVQKWAAEQDIADRVIITGKRPDVVACISSMDVGVIASQGSETIARAAFEIMSCGIPLLGTRIGVMPDLLPEWGLVSAADPAALVDILEKAITDAPWRAALREENLKRMATLSEQDFLAATLDVYTHAMSARGIQP